ncbi:hexosaminidase D [Asbolus verrucosus]|uniref:Hexosaminidase D n=1 Tax=Asbolus verrucosus TaxID=1661398 RepID=A0A482WAW2_ASBVE|nr:hexosaminidase D [Asbolus verrucosus]
MNNYVQHIGLTAWRKKSALLIAIGLLSVIIFGLQFTRLNDKPTLKEDAENPHVLAESLVQNSNVKFLDSNLKLTTVKAVSELNFEDLSNLEQPSRDEISRKRIDALEAERQLGIPYVNLNANNPYIPKKRIVHLDLKGAPPLISFFKKFFPLIRNMGATGILLEYEDMFPYSGILKNISARNSFTREQVEEILQLAEKSQLEVIPLIQTFGHVEFALKHPEWAKLREVEGSPQALCPNRNGSIDFIKEMVNQMGECDVCRLELHETIFLKHVQNVAKHIHERFPKLRLIIWDDMLRHLSQQSMLEVNLGDIVEPMVWVYAEDIYRFVQPPVWDKYEIIFKTAWAASAFKGAFGETLFVPDARRHLENNLMWLEVMSQQDRNFKRGFEGITLTGWQRYDHFAVLCELLPAGTPSLALSLLATTHGYFNSSLKHKFLSGLSCPQHNSVRNQPFINLDADPFLWDKLGRCMFPGSPFFRLTYRLHTMENEVEEYLKSTKKHKGWMTDYNVRHNYSLPLRVDELTGDLPRIYHGTTSLVRSAIDAMIDIFDNYTVNEWIEQKIYPYIIQLENIQNQSIALKSVNHWPARPLPPLKDLQRLGVPIASN